MYVTCNTIGLEHLLSPTVTPYLTPSPTITHIYPVRPRPLLSVSPLWCSLTLTMEAACRWTSTSAHACSCRQQHEPLGPLMHNARWEPLLLLLLLLLLMYYSDVAAARCHVGPRCAQERGFWLFLQGLLGCMCRYHGGKGHWPTLCWYSLTSLVVSVCHCCCFCCSLIGVTAAALAAAAACHACRVLC